MAYNLGYNLTPHAELCLEKLYIYRGATAKQLTKLVYPYKNTTLSEEKSVHNYLRKLKQQGLVTSLKLQENISRGSLYYLTPKGYELALHLFNIEEGQIGEGWIQDYYIYEHSKFADLSYDLYKPPLKQVAHHLLLIDFFIEILTHGNISGDVVDHRLNLYSSFQYEVNGVQHRYRPDAEVKIMDQNKRFTIEIDRATERGDQIREKFKTYRICFEYMEQNHIPLPVGIIFVVEEKQRTHGMKRRWASILKAFFQEMQPYVQKVNLLMTSKTKIAETLNFEIRRNDLEAKSIKLSKKAIKNNFEFDKTIPFYSDQTHQTFYMVGHNDTVFKIFFIGISNQFESMVYVRYINFLEKSLSHAFEQNITENCKYIGMSKMIFYTDSSPIFLDNFEGAIKESVIKRLLNEFESDLLLVKIERQPSPPLDVLMLTK